MRDLNKTIAYIERGLLSGLERKAAPPPKGKVPRPSIRAWRAPITSDAVYPVEQVFRPKDKLKAQPKDKPVKVTVPLDA
jgi:hypothetical protein